MSTPSHILPSSLYAKKMFCLTSHYNCADSRYEELQTLKCQGKLKSLGAGIVPLGLEDIPVKNSHRERGKGSRKLIFCLFLVYNLLK